MIGVYRELRPRSAVSVAVLLFAIAAACSGPRRGSADSAGAVLRPRSFALPDFLASSASSAADLSADRGFALAGSSDGKAFVLDLRTGGRTPLGPAGAATPLRFFPADRRVLVGRPAADAGPDPRLAVFEGAGRISEFAAAMRAHGRFLGWSSDGAGFYLARTGEGTAQEELALVSARLALSQTLYVAQAGFRIAAVTARGDRVALVRELDPDTTEVLLHDRTRSETRLLLPVDHDALFLPQAFSADGRLLFVLADEGADQLQLMVVRLDGGERRERARAGCEARAFDLAADGASYALQWSCAGAVSAGLFATASGDQLGPLPLPAGTRLARVLPAAAAGEVLYEVASGRYPRDLLLAERADPDASTRPLTFGLAPAIAAEDLVEPQAAKVGDADSTRLPAELWWPRGGPSHPPAVLWIEDDLQPPTWQEFQPFLQFLANRGVAVLRLRLRGAGGFGRRFLHAADGRLVESGLEDLENARGELARRGVDAQRIALVGDGPWPGALAATVLAAHLGNFVAAADLGGDPDPLGRLDLVSALDEPAKAWWIARLGDPASEAAQRDRQRLRFPAAASAARLFVAVDPLAHAWSAEAAAARLALAPARRLGLPPGARSYADLSPAAVAALWDFLGGALAGPP